MGDYNLHQNPHPCNELGSDDRRLSTDSVTVWRRSFMTGHGDEEGSSGGRAVDGWRSDGLPPLSKIGGGEMSSGGGDSRNSGRNIDPNMDPRKLKRIMSNRVSAQKSRLKKVQYVADMERKLKALEAHIAVLSPQVELFRNQQHVLQMEQKRLNQKILNCSRNKLIRDAEIEENKAEVNRLRELQMKQQQQSEANAWDNNAFQMPPPELSNLVSPRPNQENGERTVGGNGLGRFNSTALRRMIEYKWMPTPGLRQGFEPNSNLLGHKGMEKPN